jgi:hypothetical protein
VRKRALGAGTRVHKDDKFAGPDPVFFKIRYASTLPFGGIFPLRTPPNHLDWR